MNNKCKVVVCNLNGKLVTTDEDVDFHNFTLSGAEFANNVLPGKYIIIMIDNETRKMQMVARVDVEETVEDSAIVTGDRVFDPTSISYPLKVYTDLCPGFTTTTLVDTPDKLMEVNVLLDEVLSMVDELGDRLACMGKALEEAEGAGA